MASDRWQQIERIYHEVLEQPPEARASFVATACAGDADLLSEVQSLLASGQRDRAFLETPALHESAARLTDILGPPPVTRIGHYAIRELLSTGGMGRVYRAWDEVLERDVALKVLHPGIHDPSGATSLRGEGRAAARLTHPNICTVHEVDQYDGCPYLVMEFVAGRTLARELDRSRLPIERAVRYGAEIADALAHAHERQVLHRDLKPANVMITELDHVKVVDFGIARRLDRSAIEAITLAGADAPGMLAGTIAYMAPELLRGEPADAHSDIWSLGVVLHEMAAGVPPFSGHTDFELASAILSASPPLMPDDIPAGLRSVIHRCLAKSPLARYETAGQVRDDLQALAEPGSLPSPATRGSTGSAPGAAAPPRSWLTTGGRVAISIVGVLAVGVAGWWATQHRWTQPGVPAESRGTPVLAVLPFDVGDMGEEAEHVGIGIADGVTSRLAAVRSLRVRTTAAVAPYRARPTQEMVRELGVTHVLHGTVWRLADGYDVALRVTGGDEGSAPMASEKFVVAGDLMRVEERVAQRVARVFNVGLSASERQRLGHPTTTNPAAYEEYLRGRSSLVQPGPQAAETAVHAFEHALQVDPEYAPAQAGLAMALVRSLWHARSPADAAARYKAAMDAARRASELDPQLAQAHEAMAAVYRYTEFQWDEVVRESFAALDLSPDLDLPYYALSTAFYHLGLFDLSDRAARAGETANFRSRPEALRNRGRAALYDGRFETAARLLGEAEPMSDDGVRWMLAEAWFYLGEPDRSVALLQRVEHGSLQVIRGRATASLAAEFAARGDRAGAEARLGPLTAQQSPDHHVSHRIGTAYAQLGRPDEAVRWLRRAAQTGFPCYACFEGDRLLDPIRSDPGFQMLLDELRPRAALRRANYERLARPLF